MSGYRTRSLLSVGEKATSSRIIEELLSDENVDDDYRLYELLQDLSTGMQNSTILTETVSV